MRGASEAVRRFDEGLFRHAGDAFDLFGPREHGNAADVVERFRARRNVAVVDQAIANQDVEQSVGKRRIRARPYAQVKRRPRSRGSADCVRRTTARGRVLEDPCSQCARRRPSGGRDRSEWSNGHST